MLLDWSGKDPLVRAARVRQWWDKRRCVSCGRHTFLVNPTTGADQHKVCAEREATR